MSIRNSKVINKYVVYEWLKDRNLRSSIKHFEWYRVAAQPTDTILLHNKLTLSSCTTNGHNNQTQQLHLSACPQ